MRENKVPSVYILASKRHGTLSIGVTSDLCSRIADHKQGTIAGVTREYGGKMLVWYEFFGTMEEAIKREKQMKGWKRAWKIDPDREVQSEMAGLVRRGMWRLD